MIVHNNDVRRITYQDNKDSSAVLKKVVKNV